MEPVQDSEKDELIHGPFTVGLTSAGAENFMRRGQKVKKCHFFDGSEDYGLEIPSVSFRSLQKMAMTGLIAKIERSVTSFAVQRKHLMNLTRCFAISTVYRQFETRLWEIIGKSDILVLWNRTYPRLSISPGASSNQPAFQMLLAKAKDGILAHKQEVLKSIQGTITRDEKTLPDEKKALILLAIRYVNAIDPMIWLLLATSKDPVSVSTLERDLKSLLALYIGRSELPEYLALMLVELVVVVGCVRAEDGSASEACADEQPVFISYELGTLKKSQEERTRMRIQIGNEASEFTSLRTRIDQQSSVNLKHKSLDMFFSSPDKGENAVKNGGDLGLYYLSYVIEACHKMDISLDSFVNIVPHTKRTLINLVLAV